MKYERNWMHNNCARQGWLTEIIWSFFYAHIVRFCLCCVKWLSTISFFLVFISGSFTQSFIVYFLHLFSCWFLSCPFLRQAQFFSSFSFKYFFGHLWFRWYFKYIEIKTKTTTTTERYAHASFWLNFDSASNNKDAKRKKSKVHWLRFSSEINSRNKHFKIPATKTKRKIQERERRAYTLHTHHIHWYSQRIKKNRRHTTTKPTCDESWQWCEFNEKSSKKITKLNASLNS